MRFCNKCVWNTKFIQAITVQVCVRFTAQNTMGCNRHNRRCALAFKCCRCFDHCSGCVDHIINDDDIFAFNITDDVHHLWLIRFFTTFVNDDHLKTQLLCKVTCTCNTTDVRWSDNRIFKVFRLNVLFKNNRAIKVVYRNIKEALYLTGVKVDSHNTVNPCSLIHVRYQSGRDRYTRCRFTVLTGITVIRDNSRNRVSRWTTKSVRHDKQFHQVVIRRCSSRLNDKDVTSTNTFSDLNWDLTIWETFNISLSYRNIKCLTDRLSKVNRRSTGKNLISAHGSPFRFVNNNAIISWESEEWVKNKK